LRAGDVIQSVNGRPALTPDGVLLQLAQVPAGAAATFGVRRGGETLTVTVP
jgi:S1-C subfamily serine protease